MSKSFLKMILLWIRSLLVYKLKPHKPYVRLQETEKKKTHQRQELLRLTSRDAASESHQVFQNRLRLFNPLMPQARASE